MARIVGEFGRARLPLIWPDLLTWRKSCKFSLAGEGESLPILFDKNYSCLEIILVRAMTLLSELAPGNQAFVTDVQSRVPDDPVAARLRDLGFVAGEPVKLVAYGPFGADPMLVQVGFTRFALRRSEAERVRVSSEEPSYV